MRNFINLQISVGYVLMYFLRGSLPWQGLQAKSSNNEDKYSLILEKKMNTSIDEELCAGYPGSTLLVVTLLFSLLRFL